MTDHDAPQREDEDDQDLLTYGEATVRLAEAISAEEARLAATADEAVAARSRERIAALQAALERHQAARARGNPDFFGR